MDECPALLFERDWGMHTFGVWNLRKYIVIMPLTHKATRDSVGVRNGYGFFSGLIALTRTLLMEFGLGDLVKIVEGRFGVLGKWGINVLILMAWPSFFLFLLKFFITTVEWGIEKFKSWGLGSFEDWYTLLVFAVGYSLALLITLLAFHYTWAGKRIKRLSRDCEQMLDKMDQVRQQTDEDLGKISEIYEKATKILDEAERQKGQGP